MSVRRASNQRPEAPPPVDAPDATAVPKGPGIRSRRPATPAGTPVVGPRSLEEAEDRYVAARDAWVAAMRKANSGRSADLASLAITQEAYELATAEVGRWRSGAVVAIKIEPEAKRHEVETAIGQELAWRRVHEHHEPPPGPVGRFFRRITGRG